MFSVCYVELCAVHFASVLDDMTKELEYYRYTRVYDRVKIPIQHGYLLHSHISRNYDRSGILEHIPSFTIHLLAFQSACT